MSTVLSSVPDSARLSPPIRAITLKDVAAAAGVSTMSVSAVLNGGGRGTRQVSSEARERILRSAQELGYRRNGFAAATAKGRFGSVALLTSTRRWHSYTPQTLLDGIHAGLLKNDLHLTLANLPDEVLTDENFVPKILREWMTDGLLINYIQDVPQRLIDIIERHQIPAIWMNSKRESDCVRPDDFGAGRAATQHLIERGHTKIAWVDYSHTSRFEEEHYSAGDRFRGYEAAMQAANLAPRAIWSKEKTQFLPQNSLEFTRSWLDSPDRPTAVVAYGREVVPVLATALQLGLQVPRDLSFVTFGNTQAEFAFSPVSTFVTPEKAMGEAAVAWLLQKIENPALLVPPQILPFDFAPDQTTGPAPLV